MLDKLTIVCFGEVLWDRFSKRKRIGGAPLNVAIRLHALGYNSYMISRVGKDKLGIELLTGLKQKDLDIENIQMDDVFKTGDVIVELNEDGSAIYDICSPRAWDKIKVTEKSKSLVQYSDAFVFGSLVTRDDISKESLLTYLKIAKYKIFDVNLRPPYYNKSLLLELMKIADFIKFNDDEIIELGEMLDVHSVDIEELMKLVSIKTKTKHICVTKGKDGAILLYNDKFYHNYGYTIQVKDTVGAGDSFLAFLISELLSNVNPQQAIDRACAIGALVAQSEGANPIVTTLEMEQLIESGN